MITTPKTEQSIRTIDIPNFLKNEIKEYCDRKYAFPDGERLFPIGAEAVQHKMKRMIEKSGVPKIRVHDIRHSHVSYLINQGVEPLIIKEWLEYKVAKEVERYAKVKEQVTDKERELDELREQEYEIMQKAEISREVYNMMIDSRNSDFELREKMIDIM